MRALRFPISIELQRSRLFLVLPILAHALAVGCVLPLPWPWALRAVLLLAIALSLGYALRAAPIVELRLWAPDRLDGRLADGAWLTLDPQPESTIFSQLIVLRLRLGEARRVTSLVLLPDQMPAEQFRLLRLWLRWRDPPKEGAGTAS